MKNLKNIPIFLALSSIILPILPAYGQGGVIEEIVVTARKRDETLQEVPVAVSVLNTQKIEALRVEGVGDLSEVTPGLIASEGANNASGQIYLRGMGSGFTSPFMQNTVSVVIDGVQVDSPEILQAGMLDMQQIEVLKGPQALFYGKNSPGGVITVHTKDPGESFAAKIGVSHEIEKDESNIELVISGPITETLGGRFAAFYSKQDGDRDLISRDAFMFGTQVAWAHPEETFPARENVFTRGTLLWQPTDNFQTKLKLNYSEDELDGSLLNGNERILCPLGTPQTVIPGTDDCKMNRKIYQGAMDPSVFAAGLRNGDPSKPGGFFESEQLLASFSMTYFLPDPGLTLTSISGYYDTERSDQIEGSQQFVSILPLTRGVERTTYTQEFRVQSDWAAPVNFMVGTFYSESEDFAFYDVWLSNLGTGFNGPMRIGEEEVDLDGSSFSVFSQVDWDVTERLRVSAGMRYSAETKRTNMILNGSAVNLAPDDETWENVSPELTLTYELHESVMVYGSYKEGFKSGGFDGSFFPGAGGSDSFDIEFNQEEVNGFEIGVKTQPTDSLTLNFAAFDYDYKNLQLGSFDPATLTSKVQNAAKASVRGLEVDGNWLTPVAGMTIWGNINYLDASYDEFLAGCYLGQSIAAGCNRTFVGGRFTQQDLSGEDLVNAPEWTAGLGIDYERSVLNDWRLYMSLFETYSSSYVTHLSAIPGTKADSRAMTNASLQLTSPDRRWRLAIKGNNLTDEEYFHTTGEVTATGSPGGTEDGGTRADISAYVLTGRTITFSLEYRFSPED